MYRLLYKSKNYRLILQILKKFVQVKIQFSIMELSIKKIMVYNLRPKIKGKTYLINFQWIIKIKIQVYTTRLNKRLMIP